MASEPQANDLQKQKEECEKVAKEIFNNILAAYRIVIDEIGDDNFEEFNKIIENEIGKSMKENKFKEHLFDLVKGKFTKLWIDRDMDSSVAMLEIAKKNFVTKEKWRPTGKTAAEQLRPHLGITLSKHRDSLRKIVEDQKSQINNLVAQVEEARKMLKLKAQRHVQISSQIDNDEQRMEDTTPKIDEIIESLASSSR